MTTSYAYILGVDFTAIDIDLSAFQATIAASSISSAVVQYLTRSGTSVAIWFNGALSGGDQTTLTGLVLTYVYSAPTVLVYVDTTTVQTITNKKLDTTNTVIDASVASKSLEFSLSGMSTSTQLTLAGALTASRTYTFPEAGASSDVILSNSTGTQTISTGNLTLDGTAAILALSGATSALTLANTTASTSSTTGALRVAGGAYFGANSLLNANLTMAGTSSILALSGASAIATIANTAASTSSTTGALRVAGGAYFGANSLLNANLTMAGTSAIFAMSGASAIATFANTTISTSSTTGTIRNLGGLFTKNMWLGGVAFVTQAVSTAGPLLNIAATTITANNTSDMAFVAIQQPTLANSVISSVTANAATVYIADAPAAGTNQTITNPFSLNVAAGKVRFGGAFQLTTGAANGYLLSSDASGNASWISPLPFGYFGFADGTVSAPGAYWASETSTGFYRIGAGNIALTLSGAQYINYTPTFSSFLNTLQISKAGNATSTLASLYSNPASTLFSGSNNYFFNYFNTPTSTGSTTGTASTVFIAGAPSNATTPLALNVAAGKVRFAGAFQLTTGAVNNYLLTSDASGNATWSAPEGVVSLADYNAISTTSFSTNSITATNITAMTLTPTVAGTYWITYTSNFRGTNSNTTCTFDLALNGTAITNATNIFPQTTQTNTYTVVINVLQVFNGTTDTIVARTRVNATSTSVTIIYRSMLALRVSA